MPVRMSIEVTTPIDDDDREVVAGLAYMLVAVANRGQEEQEEQVGQPQPCGAISDNGRICVSETGHRGRHRYRSFEGGVN